MMNRERVVGVFVTGAVWQFRDWKWKAPNEVFSHVCGFYMKFDGEAVAPSVGLWNTTILKVC